jgi:hypothetical protein
MLSGMPKSRLRPDAPGPSVAVSMDLPATKRLSNLRNGHNSGGCIFPGVGYECREVPERDFSGGLPWWWR